MPAPGGGDDELQDSGALQRLRGLVGQAGRDGAGLSRSEGRLLPAARRPRARRDAERRLHQRAPHERLALQPLLAGLAQAAAGEVGTGHLSVVICQ